MASGRSGTSNKEYRRNRAILLANNDICWLCGHGGAMTADHVITHKRWPRDGYGNLLPGFNGLNNLRPAHGTMGGTGALNRCPICKKLCNQNRKDRVIETRRSRTW